MARESRNGGIRTMALTDIVRGRRETRVEYRRFFERLDMPGAGFSFPADENGFVKIEEVGECAADSMARCLAGLGTEFADRGVRKLEWSYWVPGHGTCACGREVVLDGDTRGEGIDCECGRIYNGVGQELAPRRQWEEAIDED